MHRRHEEFTKLLLEQAATTIKIQQEQASMEMKMSMQHSHSILHGVAIGKCQGKLELLRINVQLLLVHVYIACLMVFSNKITSALFLCVYV